MTKMTKHFLWMAGLMFGLQMAGAFSLIGPLGTGGDSWQTAVDGFNPLQSPPANPYGFTDGLLVGPKNIGEEYRRNTPVMYYTFDDNFTGFYGSNGTNAVAGAFAILNNLTNVSSYSADLTEFPLRSQAINYSARALGLRDLKSLTLTMLMEQLGVADSIRYTWVLHSRYNNGTTPCPAGESYLVAPRNFAINPTPLDQFQYSPYVNNSLYSYIIYEDCGAAGSAAPIDGTALPLPVNPLNVNPPVASGHGVGFLSSGGYYTGLTRDDVAGLRYLLRAANVNTESPAAGSQVQTTTLGSQTVLTTSDLNALVTAAATTSPTNLVAQFPGLVVASSSSYYTNINGAFVQRYNTTFANVITNTYSANTTITIATTTIGSPIGSPYGTPAITNTTTQTYVTNVPSGDFYVLPSGDCGLNILQSGPAFTNVTTTLITTTTNATSTNTVSQIITFIGHTYLVQAVNCSYATPTTGKYEGIESIKFVGIDASKYDTLLGQFYTPITNNYKMSLLTTTNGVVTVQNFQRVVTTPDFLFSARDAYDVNGNGFLFDRTDPAFNQANILPNLDGPGTIDPGTTVTFNKSGPLYTTAPTSLLQFENSSAITVFGSFDGTTNTPVIYPNGTSIADLEAELLIQISPSTLPVAIVGSPYSAAFSVTGGQAPYTWSLSPTSQALPDGLTISSGGVISGTPTQNGVYDFVIQINDSASHIVRQNYSITIQ